VERLFRAKRLTKKGRKGTSAGINPPVITHGGARKGLSAPMRSDSKCIADELI
jgi:hypothetical protein